jgi:hypothetical protein
VYGGQAVRKWHRRMGASRTTGQVSTKVNCEKLGQSGKRSAAVPGQDGRGSYPEYIFGPPGEMLGLLSPLVTAVSCCANPFCSLGGSLPTARKGSDDLLAKSAAFSGFEPRDERICERREFSVLCVGRYKTEIDAETSLSERSGERSLNN